MEGEAVATVQQQREEEIFMKAASLGHSNGAEIDKNSGSPRNLQHVQEVLSRSGSVDDKMVVKDGDINRRSAKRGDDKKRLNTSGKVLGRGRPGCQPVEPSTGQNRVSVPGANSYVRGTKNICTERRSCESESSSTDDNFLRTSPAVKRGDSKPKMPGISLGRGQKVLSGTDTSPKVGKCERNLSPNKKSSVKPTNIFSPVQSAKPNVGDGKIMVSPKDKTSPSKKSSVKPTNIFSPVQSAGPNIGNGSQIMVSPKDNTSPSKKGSVKPTDIFSPVQSAGPNIGDGSQIMASPKDNASPNKKSSVKPTNIFSPVQSAGPNIGDGIKIMASPKDNKVSPGNVKNKSEKSLGRGQTPLRGIDSRRPGVKQSGSPERQESDVLKVQKFFDVAKSLHESEFPEMPDVIPRDYAYSVGCEDEQTPSR